MLNTSSCSVVFWIFHMNANFQIKILNLSVIYKGLRIELT